MTKRKALLLLLLLACSLIGGVVVIATGNREPSYHGKALSEWLDRRSPIPHTQRVVAVQQIGTNALPLLLQWIQYNPSPFEWKLSLWLNPFHIDPFRKKVRHREDAVLGFSALGEKAKPAIPTLALLVDGTNNINRRLAARALSFIGKDALPTLVDLVTNTLAHTNCDREDVATAFLGLQTNAFLAKPVMLTHIRDPNEQVASAAIIVLANLEYLQERIPLSPDTTADIVPALCANLDTTNTHVSLQTILALIQFRSNGRKAVPFLLQNLTSTNKTLRDASTTALRKIDPQTLERAQKP